MEQGDKKGVWSIEANSQRYINVFQPPDRKKKMNNWRITPDRRSRCSEAHRGYFEYALTKEILVEFVR